MSRYQCPKTVLMLSKWAVNSHKWRFFMCVVRVCIEENCVVQKLQWANSKQKSRKALLLVCPSHAVANFT